MHQSYVGKENLPSWSKFAGYEGDQVLLASIYSAALQGPGFIRGDADGNGVFNGLTDGIYILGHQFLGGPPPPCMESADADGDGDFNGLSDGLYVLAHAFQGGPPPGAPYPDCGADPDPTTSLGCDDQPGCP